MTVADTMGKQDTQKYRGYLELAEKRLLLDISEVDKLAKKLEFDCIPVKASSERMLFEYALGMQIKLKNGEYVDFIRAITPILVDLFELVLKVQCKIDINNYCKWITKRDGTKLRRWDMEKLRGTEIEKVLNEAFSGSFNQNGDVYSIHIKALIEYFSTDAQLKELICNLRLTEEKIRNTAAHDIVSVTEITIKNRTGFSADKIMQMIQKLFIYTGIKIKKEYWDSYDQMNQAILQKNGADRSMGALYFMNPDYSDPDNVKWFHGALTYLFTDGGVEFFR